MIGSSNLMPAFWAASRLAHRAAAAYLERQRGRIDVVILAVGQPDVEIDDREADQRAGLGGLAHPLLDRRDIFLRDVAALDVVLEDDPRAALARRQRHLDLGELAGAAGLLLVGVDEVDRPRERL